MARVVATILPTAQIEPYTGFNGSLNLFVGLVARSGYFKGATMGAARDAVAIDYVYETGPGSGEGINHVFAYYDTKAKKTEWKRHNVYLSVPRSTRWAISTSATGQPCCRRCAKRGPART